jgi:hypothetical protein
MHPIYFIEAIVVLFIIAGASAAYENDRLSLLQRRLIIAGAVLLSVSIFAFTWMNWRVETYETECWETECVSGHWEDGWGDRVKSDVTMGIIVPVVRPRNRDREREWVCDEEKIVRYECEQTRLVKR